MCVHQNLNTYEDYCFLALTAVGFLLFSVVLNKVTFWLRFCKIKVTFSSSLGHKKSP